MVSLSLSSPNASAGKTKSDKYLGILTGRDGRVRRAVVNATGSGHGDGTGGSGTDDESGTRDSGFDDITAGSGTTGCSGSDDIRTGPGTAGVTAGDVVTSGPGLDVDSGLADVTEWPGVGVASAGSGSSARTPGSLGAGACGVWLASFASRLRSDTCTTGRDGKAGTCPGLRLSPMGVGLCQRSVPGCVARVV
ncbi:jacalin-related lectin 34-like [Branchiostoma floridae]|uniref:Jacalin-related lectin 34-like n=1 Tax=Branchiostoma floridae TaxID=7739 RepID=A0A9J7LGV9_BRAFL|nr:jacalin-related lectin 34-like [Branchiostoma floridae]